MSAKVILLADRPYLVGQMAQLSDRTTVRQDNDVVSTYDVACTYAIASTYAVASTYDIASTYDVTSS